MSETHVTETVPAQPRKTGGTAPATSLRFTPLRSHIVARKGGRDTSGDRVLSQLVPVRRLQN